MMRSAKKEKAEAFLAQGAWRRLMQARGSTINVASVMIFDASK